MFESRSQANVDESTLLEALGDPRSKAILQATAEPMTVEELSEACDIPLSTTYRQVTRLEGARLLEEKAAVAPDGRCAAQYQRTVEKLELELVDEELAVRVLE